MAAYIILGIAVIGREIENPFGIDVNDLPLDSYCSELANELDLIMSMPAPKLADFVAKEENLILHPLSKSGYGSWSERDIGEIRDALAARVRVGRAALVRT